MNVKAKVISMCINVNLRFSVELIYKTPVLFLEIVFYPESQSKQTWLRTELLMVKQPTLRSLVRHVQCVHVFNASPCVFINCVQVGVCVWFTAGINNNHRAALSLTDRSRHMHTSTTESWVQENTKHQPAKSETETHQVCLLWQLRPAVTSILWWADGHLSLLLHAWSLLAQGQYKSLTSQF